jgi:hypothetical protein
MKLSAKKIVLIAAIAVIALLCLADEYPAMRFRGDGKISGAQSLGTRSRSEKSLFTSQANIYSTFAVCRAKN